MWYLLLPLLSLLILCFHSFVLLLRIETYNLASRLLEQIQGISLYTLWNPLHRILHDHRVHPVHSVDPVHSHSTHTVHTDAHSNSRHWVSTKKSWCRWIRAIVISHRVLEHVQSLWRHHLILVHVRRVIKPKTLHIFIRYFLSVHIGEASFSLPAHLARTVHGVHIRKPHLLRSLVSVVV